MDFPISLEEFTDLGRGTHLAEGVNAPKGDGTKMPDRKSDRLSICHPKNF